MPSSQSPPGRTEGNTTCAPNPFNTFPWDIRLLKYFVISYLQPLGTQLERMRAYGTPLALSDLEASSWFLQCAHMAGRKLSGEINWTANKSLSAPSQLLRIFAFFGGTVSNLGPWLDQLDRVACFQVWITIYTLFSFHPQSFISVG